MTCPCEAACRTPHGPGRSLSRVTRAGDTWWGRDLPSSDVIIGHGDAAPWNFLSRAGRPLVLLDRDTAGPMGREWDVAQTAWLNAQLHDDDIAERIGLPDAVGRARRLRAFCDGYGLVRMERESLVDMMIEVAVRTSAQEAIDAGVSPDGLLAPDGPGLLGGGRATGEDELLWAVTWRVRAARWMLQNRRVLDRAFAQSSARACGAAKATAQPDGCPVPRTQSLPDGRRLRTPTRTMNLAANSQRDRYGPPQAGIRFGQHARGPDRGSGRVVEDRWSQRPASPPTRHRRVLQQTHGRVHPDTGRTPCRSATAGRRRRAASVSLHRGISRYPTAGSRPTTPAVHSLRGRTPCER